LSSIAPKPIQTLVMSAVILPSALSRETLAETGRLSSNNLCVAMRLTIPAPQQKGEKEGQSETEARQTGLVLSIGGFKMTVFGIAFPEKQWKRYGSNGELEAPRALRQSRWPRRLMEDR
jgi:hypothetical protein